MPYNNTKIHKVNTVQGVLTFFEGQHIKIKTEYSNSPWYLCQITKITDISTINDIELMVEADVLTAMIEGNYDLQRTWQYEGELETKIVKKLSWSKRVPGFFTAGMTDEEKLDIVSDHFLPNNCFPV
jgi:hypothetical protein